MGICLQQRSFGCVCSTLEGPTLAVGSFGSDVSLAAHIFNFDVKQIDNVDV